MVLNLVKVYLCSPLSWGQGDKGLSLDRAIHKACHDLHMEFSRDETVSAWLDWGDLALKHVPARLGFADLSEVSRWNDDEGRSYSEILHRIIRAIKEEQ